MNLITYDVSSIAKCITFLLVLALFLHFYKLKLLAQSIKFCNWICGMAISSDSPWIKILALNLVFLLRLLMYFAIISLEHMDKLTTRSLLKYYISGSKLVLSEYIMVFVNSSEKIEISITNEINPVASQIKRSEPEEK